MPARRAASSAALIAAGMRGALQDDVEVPRRDVIRADLDGAVYSEVPGPLQRAREDVGRHHFGRAAGSAAGGVSAGRSRPSRRPAPACP